MIRKEKYIPALRYERLTPLYDPILRWVMREDIFKNQLVHQANIQPGQRVLDLGCGTATLTIMIKQAHPEVEVIGLDGDTRVLEIGRAKAAHDGVEITLDQGMSFQLPYPDGSFDRVLSSLLFHHLTPENKRRTLPEVYRVLRPGGELHMADFGKPATVWSSWVSPLMAKLEEASENHQGLLPRIFEQAGFVQIKVGRSISTIFGTLDLLYGQKPLDSRIGKIAYS